jgi:hypothetical protein
MARRLWPKTREEALRMAASLVGEHNTVGGIVVWDTSGDGAGYARWIPVGDEAQADALLEAAVKHGMTKEQADGKPAGDGEDEE